ncbi:MAG: fibronectin type III domain-containing protein, partial [Geopsychrobacter sp.]|nr:fibronectin type III domain-containing protein [Geopsychrobacter sp.]
KDQSTSFYYNALASGLYFNNGQFAAYDGNGIKYPSPAQYYTYTDYQFRVVALVAGGARYLKRKAGETIWTSIIDTSADAGRDKSPTLRLAVHQAAQDALISRMQVRKAVTESLVSLGSEEQAAGGCYSYANLWESGFSTEDVWAATPAPVAPSGLSGVLLANGAELNWSWNGDADADFIVARCQTGNCTTLADVATVPAGTHTYLDSSILPSIAYHYRVRATKPSACGGWQSAESNELVVTTLPGGVSDLQATAVNSRMIRLDWTSLAGDEDGYQLLKQTQTGLFVPLLDLPAAATSHSDTLALEPETTYRYRIRAWRIESVGPPEIRSYGGFSNTVEVQTLPWIEGDGVCAQ